MFITGSFGILTLGSFGTKGFVGPQLIIGADFLEKYKTKSKLFSNIQENCHSCFFKSYPSIFVSK